MVARRTRRHGGERLRRAARAHDLDGDGDLEIVSIGFDERRDLGRWVST